MFSFCFLHDLDSINADCIEEAAAKLVSTYKNDLELSLGIALIQCNEFLKLFKDDQSDHFSREHFFYMLIIDKGGQDTFPNVEIALPIYLVLTISNCTGE